MLSFSNEDCFANFTPSEISKKRSIEGVKFFGKELHFKASKISELVFSKVLI